MQLLYASMSEFESQATFCGGSLLAGQSGHLPRPLLCPARSADGTGRGTGGLCFLRPKRRKELRGERKLFPLSSFAFLFTFSNFLYPLSTIRFLFPLSSLLFALFPPIPCLFPRFNFLFRLSSLLLLHELILFQPRLFPLSSFFLWAAGALNRWAALNLVVHATDTRHVVPVARGREGRVRPVRAVKDLRAGDKIRYKGNCYHPRPGLLFGLSLRLTAALGGRPWRMGWKIQGLRTPPIRIVKLVERLQSWNAGRT